MPEAEDRTAAGRSHDDRVLAELTPEEQVQVLFVCTANQCRSPLAAAFLRTRLHDVAPEVDVQSAGASAIEGAGVTAATSRAASARDVDLSGHRSAPLDPQAIHDADLVIGMERRHLHEAVLHDPTVFERAFTLKEFVRRGCESGRREPGETVREYARRVGAGRRAIDLLGSSSEDDLADPTTNRHVRHDRTATEIDGYVAL